MHDDEPMPNNEQADQGPTQEPTEEEVVFVEERVGYFTCICGASVSSRQIWAHVKAHITAYIRYNANQRHLLRFEMGPFPSILFRAPALYYTTNAITACTSSIYPIIRTQNERIVTRNLFMSWASVERNGYPKADPNIHDVQFTCLPTSVSRGQAFNNGLLYFHENLLVANQLVEVAYGGGSNIQCRGLSMYRCDFLGQLLCCEFGLVFVVVFPPDLDEECIDLLDENMHPNVTVEDFFRCHGSKSMTINDISPVNASSAILWRGTCIYIPPGYSVSTCHVVPESMVFIYRYFDRKDLSALASELNGELECNVFFNPVVGRMLCMNILLIYLHLLEDMRLDECAILYRALEGIPSNGEDRWHHYKILVKNRLTALLAELS